MKTYEKIYIGKGKKVGDLNIVKVTLKLDDLQAMAYEFEGNRYVTFEVAQLINPDNFGRTHTVYYNKQVAEKTGQPKQKKPTARRSKKATVSA